MSNSSGPPIHVIRTGRGAEGIQGEPTLFLSTTSNYTWLYDDSHSGAHKDVTLYRPTPSDSTYSILGDYAQGNYYHPSGISLIVKAINDDPAFPLLKPPIGYSEAWSDRGSGGRYDGSVWFPVPPDGYISIGFVGQSGYDPPVVSSYACVRRDLCVDAQPGELIWEDRHSGAHMDVSLYQIIGVSGAFVAQSSYSPYTGPCHKLPGS